jgi:hypothetical protein
MALHRITVHRGDTYTIPVVFKNSAGVAYCIKNWALHFTAKTNWSLPDAEASIQKIVTTFDDTTSGTSGSANITLTHSDTNIDPGEYDYDIQVTTAASEVATVSVGKLEILYAVTDTAGTAGTAA